MTQLGDLETSACRFQPIIWIYIYYILYRCKDTFATRLFLSVRETHGVTRWIPRQFPAPRNFQRISCQEPGKCDPEDLQRQPEIWRSRVQFGVIMSSTIYIYVCKIICKNYFLMVKSAADVLFVGQSQTHPALGNGTYNAKDCTAQVLKMVRFW